MEGKGKRYIGRKAVMARYGISEPTLAGWMANPDIDFDKPLIINNVAYFDVDKLDLFDERRTAIPHHGSHHVGRGRPRKQPQRKLPEQAAAE